MRYDGEPREGDTEWAGLGRQRHINTSLQNFCEYLRGDRVSKATQYPFDLDRALAGEKLVTRDGRSVTSFRVKPTKSKSLSPYSFTYVATVINNANFGETKTFSSRGRYLDSDNPLDLFMAEPARYPFDLSAALSGAKLITRNGESVKGFAVSDLRGFSKDYTHKAYVGASGVPHAYTPKGTWWNDGSATEYDLFLAEPPPVVASQSVYTQSALLDKIARLEWERDNLRDKYQTLTLKLAESLTSIAKLLGVSL
jgi:hypothetical protein